jgi:hypothetical protein
MVRRQHEWVKLHVMGGLEMNLSIEDPQSLADA